ncbi:hypothetical protein KC19_4G082500 [Ceratodon purpureus]|uniref:Protein-serine/threonine phosphatase n=1 Tax=Ceratodon purpureus TaxID=3225 RepID=A0A8T0I8A7_CERPU|nr:hypothetical protein KC19_4G082500 [Ceratodon purpureus]
MKILPPCLIFVLLVLKKFLLNLKQRFVVVAPSYVVMQLNRTCSSHGSGLSKSAPETTLHQFLTHNRLNVAILDDRMCIWSVISDTQ